MPSTVVEVGLTLAGDLASFDAVAQAGLTSTLQALLGCHEPACFLELRVSPASIRVAATLTIPDATPGGGAALSAQIATTATDLLAQPPGALSSSLNVDVQATAPVTVATGVSAVLAVAPPPPSPPPSSAPPLVGNGSLEQGTARGGSDGGGLGVVIVVSAVVALAAMASIVCLYYCRSKKVVGARQRLRSVVLSRAPTAPTVAISPQLEMGKIDSAAATSSASIEVGVVHEQPQLRPQPQPAHVARKIKAKPLREAGIRLVDGDAPVGISEDEYSQLQALWREHGRADEAEDMTRL